ncbi:MAG: phage terminase large subunit family protein [Verrucomicrobiota bacterium]
MMFSTAGFVTSVFKRVLRARPTQPIHEWGEENIKLDTKESADFPGRYDSSLTPHTRILFDVASSGDWDEFVCRKSSQSGFTLACLILICYWVVNFSRNIFYCIDSRDEARKISTERLQPMLRNCAAADGKIAENDDGITNLTLSLKGLTIYLAGANSVGALANKSIGLAIADEVDAYRTVEHRTESHPVHLLRDRTKRVSDAFFVEISKPDQWESQLNQDYLKGSRHRCFVPCPHCDFYQTIDFKQLKFEHCKDLVGGWDADRVLTETYYECANPACKGKIEEKHKPEMMSRYEWRRTNYGQDRFKPKPRRFSCDISDLYSTFPKAAWGIIVSEWLDAQGDSDKLDHFRRNRLGEPVRKKTVEVRDSHMSDMEGTYEHGHCPVVPDLVTMGVDKQLDVYKWVKMAWRIKEDEAYIVDYGTCISERDLLLAADTPVIVDDWGDTPEDEQIDPVVLTGLIDEGFDTFVVRNFCLQTVIGEMPDGTPMLRFYPARGAGGTQVKDVVEAKERYSQAGHPVTAYQFSDDNFKTIVYEHCIAGRKKILEERAEGNVAKAPLIHMMRNPDPSFTAELCQEERKLVVRGNQYIQQWAKPKGANDFGDGVKLNFVDWYVVKPYLLAFDPDESPPEEGEQEAA